MSQLSSNGGDLLYIILAKTMPTMQIHNTYIYFCMKETWDHVSVDQLWANCIMGWMPVANRGPQSLTGISTTHCCVERPNLIYTYKPTHIINLLTTLFPASTSGCHYPCVWVGIGSASHPVPCYFSRYPEPFLCSSPEWHHPRQQPQYSNGSHPPKTDSTQSCSHHL